MLRSFWRTVDRFSLPHFENIIYDLREIEIVDKINRDAVIDILQSIVEIVTYGDKHDPSIFECFMELQVLAEFVRMLKISNDSRVKASVLQYLSILIQNLESERAIYYCLSNDYVNSVITHEYEFNAGDLALYYVSFLRAVSGKLSEDTLCLLVKVQEGAVISFPLYTEAIRFAHHGEKMIQTAIRSLALSIYNVSDDMVYKFLTTPPVSEYFSDLVLKLREDCVHLDTTISSLGDNYTSDKRKELLSGINKLLDDLYYFKDLLCVGKSHLSAFLTQKLLGLLVVPIVIPLMQLGETTGVKISAATSLYLLSRILQVVENKEILDSVASLVLCPHMSVSAVPFTEADVLDSNQMKPSADYGKAIEQILDSTFKSEELDKDISLVISKNKLSACHFLSCQWNNAQERVGILSYIFSDNQGLLLASLMLLIVLAESEDLDNLLASVFGFPRTKSKTDDTAALNVLNRSFFVQCLPQIVNALLKILGGIPMSPVLTRWHTGWFLVKIISLQRATFNHQELHLFNVNFQLNASFQLARECLLTELGGCWFDHIPDTFNREWISCKKAVEESTRMKDPFFIFEIVLQGNSSDGNSIDAWQKMVDAVQISVLHALLKAHIIKGCMPDDPLITLRSSSVSSPSSKDASDASSTKYGSLVPLGSGVPCKIAFSKLGIRDIYMIPEAKGVSGKLLLVEKHPFHSRDGIVLAIAPLAGLAPKIDEKQSSWLHLHVREFTHKISEKRSIVNVNSSSHEKIAIRWTLGFPDPEACEAARLLIHEETRKQRSSVESILAPFLYDNHPSEEEDCPQDSSQAC